MIILFDVILISVTIIHCWKHISCSQLKSIFCACCNRYGIQEEEFGSYPVVFVIYATFQILFSASITFIYIYDIININYEYDGDDQTWNDMDMIPQIIFYPFSKSSKQSYTFINEPKFTLGKDPTNNITKLTKSISNDNLFFIINISIIILIYIIEAFMHWYRYYTVYVAQKYLKNFSFCVIVKYYMIYVSIMILIIGISIFLQNYIGILIAICHLCFSVYCSNQQIKILLKSTTESFDG